MANEPDRQDDVEYVDAQPIGDEPSAPVFQQPQVRTYYYQTGGNGCLPCCGPFGCALMLIAFALLISNPQLLRGVLYAMAIMIAVSFFAGMLSRR